MNSRGDCALDIIVVGAGVVGALVSLLMTERGHKVTLIEKRNLVSDRSSSDQPSDRTVALSNRSWQLLSSAKLWPDIEACAIRFVRVSQRGRFGSVRLSADQMRVEALGYVLGNDALEAYLHQHVRDESAIKVFEGVSVESIDTLNCGVSVVLADKQTQLKADLLIAADGNNSLVRDRLGIATIERDYQQCAVIATVQSNQPHEHTAHERFTRKGPLALLPVGASVDGQYSMVFTSELADLEKLKNISDLDFLNLLQQKFGGKVGRFETIGKRFVTPLRSSISESQVHESCVLIGNAARSLHPVTGQGLNLALRDVFELVSLIYHNPVSSSEMVRDISTVLEKFHNNRKTDQRLITFQTDTLARWFSGRWQAPIAAVNSVTFLLLDTLTPVKSQYAKFNMGHHVPLPR